MSPAEKADWYLSSLTLKSRPGEQRRAVLPDQASNGILIIDLETGEIESTITEIRLGTALSVALWTAVVLCGALLCVFLVILYVKGMRKRPPLLLKQLALFVPLIVMAMTAVSVFVYDWLQLPHRRLTSHEPPKAFVILYATRFSAINFRKNLTDIPDRC